MNEIKKEHPSLKYLRKEHANFEIVGRPALVLNHMPKGHLIQYHRIFWYIYKHLLSLEKGGPSIAFKMTQRRFSIGRASGRAGEEVGGKRYTI